MVGKILIVDDEANARNALAELLSGEGYTVATAPDGFKALAKAADFAPDVTLTDLKMPGMDGLGLLAKLREADPHAAVVVMTAFGAVDTAVTAMREGATDYLTKPLNMDELGIVIERALERRRLFRETEALRAQLDDRYSFENIVGKSPEMQQVFKVVAQVAQSRATVLISGDSGTGKELIAAAIHQRSSRAKGPFVKLHCAALAETLLESELFGHERGSFTGADRRREGRFEQANGGTLFLDEIGEIPLSTQVKLLRVLQQRELERVGGNQTIQVDVRLVAATNRDLKALVQQGLFREDLYYRLNVVNIRMPSLRERSGDVSALANHFLRKYAEENGKHISGISEGAWSRLLAYHWPGNVRELENVIERAVVLAEADTIEAQHLPPEVAPAPAEVEGIQIPGWKMADIERYAILRTLESVGGSTARTAEILGISIRKVQYKLQEFSSAPKSNMPAIEEENHIDAHHH